MQAHILAHFIDEEGYEKLIFPFLALTISGAGLAGLPIAG
jgi:N6-L-threonylcarbamoyladenine synthase